MSRPSKVTLPLSARNSPLIKLTSVVLPAPFEPISPTTPPGSIVSDTASTATLSPKALVSCCTARSGMSRGLARAPRELDCRAHQPVRDRQDKHDQDDAEQQLPVNRVADGEGLEVVVDEGADDRAEEGLEAPEHRHEDDLAAERPVENIRRGEPVQRHPERARQAREARGRHERDEAVAPHPHADKLGAHLVVADRLQRLAERRAHDEPHRRDGDDEHDEHVVVVLEREERGLVGGGREQSPEQRRRRDPQAVGAAADPEELEREAPQHLRQREREDGEEDLRVPHAHRAHDDADVQRRRDAAEEIQLHRLHAEVLEQQRRDVGAGAEERGMAEGQEPGVAEQQVERERGDAEDEPVGDLQGLERVEEPRQDGEHQHRGGGPPQLPAIHRQRRGRGDGVHARPNRPVGRMNSTMAAKRYSTASSITATQVMPSVRTAPTISEPTSAPSSEPRPPITTTTNARISASTPMPSTAPEIGITTAPPRPAMKQPIANASTYTRFTSMPRAAAILMSWEVARKITPKRVR